MLNHLLGIYTAARTFILNDEAQDLAEYAMTVALVALGTVAGMQSLASGVTLAFNDVSSTISLYLVR